MRRWNARKPLAVAVNVVLRLIVVGVVGDALVNADAPRYADKAIGIRGLTLILASLLVRALYALGLRRPYPIWTDNLYVSIFALDMAGNLFDLYDTYPFFDLLPHAHGTGAIALVTSQLLGIGVLAGIGIAQIAHIALEAQEYYSDVWFGLHNVRGTWDTVNDLVIGAAGSIVYGGIYVVLRRRRRAPDAHARA